MIPTLVLLFPLVVWTTYDVSPTKVSTGDSNQILHHRKSDSRPLSLIISHLPTSPSIILCCIKSSLIGGIMLLNKVLYNLNYLRFNVTKIKISTYY